MKTIFEHSEKERDGFFLESFDYSVNVEELVGQENVSSISPLLPEVNENIVIRHYTNLSRLNHSIDSGFYPLGSCTMKHNPRINEKMAALPGFTQLHPELPEEYCQGSLELIYSLEKSLAEILGMKRVTMQPLAGAHGEFTGLNIIAAYHKKNGEKRTKIVVPDSSHGTNPASAAMLGMELVQIESNEKGMIDLNKLKESMGADVAAFMLTNPNTLGIFDENILKIAEIVHECGALLYYDGANLNATMGFSRPGDCGFDVVHTNLHKTFSTPHGGGGPGAGPVGVVEKLVSYLPTPVVDFDDGKYHLNCNLENSIGKIAAFHGNFGVLVKAFTYISALGGEGLKAVSENAVLNANYLYYHLKDLFPTHHNSDYCMHEFVLSADNMKEYGIQALDIAKRLLDYGIHAPTIYFPLIVHEAMMIEPTESESKETLDEFIEVMKKIYEEAKSNPELLHNSPQTTPVGRLDETKAARTPVLRWMAD